jgi:hypothetical protein
MGFWGGLKDMLVGGSATKDLNTQGANYGASQGYLQNAMNTAGGRAAPTSQAAQLGPAAQLNGAPQDQFRQQQMGMAGRLGAIASGQQAGAGELAVNRQVGQGIAAQQAGAQMARGANAALAARQAARSTADLNVNGAGMAAQAQMGDQMNANQQLGGLLAQGRGQDLDMAGQNANFQQQQMMQQGQFNQQTGLANQSAQLAQTGMNDAYGMSATQGMMGLDQQQYQNELQKRQLQLQDKGILPGLLQTAGQIGATYATGGLSQAAKPAGGWSNGTGSLYGMGK